jgi:hypothetical protein
MLTKLYARAHAPNFYNNRRQAAIDHLIKRGINPFEAVMVAPEARQPESLTGLEDRYIGEMRTMPRLTIETAWELTDMRKQVEDLTARIFDARRAA